MIPTILMFGVLAGLDNLQVCASVGLLPMPRSRMRLLAAGFLFCEMAAPLIGLLVGRAALSLIQPYSHLVAPLMTLLCGLGVLISQSREHRVLLSLPPSLSLDNLVAGIGIGALPYPVWSAALTIGAVSGGMSCLGLYGASRLRRWMALPRVELLMGVYLCIVAVRMALVDRS